MVDQVQETRSLILYGGMLGMFFLALAIVGFVLIYKKRLLQQQMKLQEERLGHQQQLLQSSVKIQDEERKRFAADLHDEIGGGISSILLSIERIKKEQANIPEIVSKAENARDQLNDLLQKVREISYNIMPPTLQDFGLQEAISDLCYSISESSPFTINYEWNGSEKRLEFSQELAIYRITQELLTNIIKHSEAKNVAIAIENSDKAFELYVKDNGKGYNPETLHKGAGIKNINDRAAIIGAELSLSGVIGEGTLITLYLNKEKP